MVQKNGAVQQVVMTGIETGSRRTVGFENVPQFDGSEKYVGNPSRAGLDLMPTVQDHRYLSDSEEGST